MTGAGVSVNQREAAVIIDAEARLTGILSIGSNLSIKCIINLTQDAPTDTGMRLAEAVGLTLDDMKLESTYPHLVLLGGR